MDYVRIVNAAIALLVVAPSLFGVDYDALGLTSYKNLKDDSYDFSIIERAQNFLDGFEDKSLRPNHCPLNQTTGQDFLDKLGQLEAALKTSACTEYKDSFMTTFSSSVSKIGQANYTSPLRKPDASTTLPPSQQAHYRNVSDMVDSLSGLVSDARCAFDIKERGLIPVVSDILGSASVSALYVPNEIAYMAGLAGLAVTSTLKIISSLLQSSYDMREAKDRENFVKLACSFYDLQSDLDRSNFLHIPSDRDVLNHVLTSSYLDALTSITSWLESTKTQSLVHIISSKDAFMRSTLGEAKYNFQQNADVLRTGIEISRPSNENAPRSLSYRLNLVSTLTAIAAQVSAMQFDHGAYSLFTDIGTHIWTLTNHKEILTPKRACKRTDEELAALFVPSFDAIATIIAQENADAETKFYEQNLHDKLTYGALQNDIVAQFDDRLDSINHLVVKLSIKEAELAKINARKNFTADDEGTHIDHAIVVEIKNIQSAIFGHYGWRFFEYVRDEAEKELNAFHDGYFKFENKYLPAAGQKMISMKHENSRRVACATVDNLLLSINNSRSLVNMAADFIFTNRDFFHENVPALDIHLKFIPTGHSIQRQLLDESRTLVDAKAFIASKNQRVNFPFAVENASYFARPHLGDLMVAQTFADKRIVELYRFKEVNRCGLANLSS